MQRSVQLNHLAGNLATQAKALTYLLRQWGLPLWLNIDPDLSLLYNLTDAPAFLAVLVCALAGSVWCWRTRPWLGFAIAWALVHLVMLYVLLPRLDIANDRQLYLACWPLGMVLVVEVSRWKWPANKAVVLTMLALCLGGLTFLRNDNYRDEISLWETTLPLSVGKARAHSNLGYAYQLAGRANDARREYQAALQIDPQHIKARYNLQRLAMPVPE
jgi:tetratricopeptide (TPR) repeat protein